RAPCVAACAPSRMSTFFNISDSSLDDTFYPKSVSRKTGAAALARPIYATTPLASKDPHVHAA
ncbi:MAG: hypothetical protein VB124_04030, partial [Burkholderia sp.]